jgi:hypothetical protein
MTEEAIRSTVIQVVHGIDACRFDVVRAVYADMVDVDYTSLFGGTAQMTRADDLIQGWKRHLTGVATQHLLVPISVQMSDVTALAECHVCAWHWKGPQAWTAGAITVLSLDARPAIGK